GGRGGRAGGRAGRRRPALAGVCELRPVRELRAARRGVPAARAEPGGVRRGELEGRLLTLVTLGLVAFGLVMVYSATSGSAAISDRNPTSYLERQGFYAVLGLALMIAASRFDYRRLRAAAPALVLGSLALCLL